MRWETCKGSLALIFQIISSWLSVFRPGFHWEKYSVILSECSLLLWWKSWCLYVDTVTSSQSENTHRFHLPVSMVCANISSPSSWAGGSSDVSGGSFRHSWASCMLEVMLDDQPWESQPPAEYKQNHMGFSDFCTSGLLCKWFITEDSTPGLPWPCTLFHLIFTLYFDWQIV